MGYISPMHAHGGHVISSPIWLEGRPVRMSLNVDGLSNGNRITVEVLDERFRPVPEYGREEYISRESGLYQPVEWESQRTVGGLASIRVRVDFEGIRPEDIRLYAVYVTEVDD